MIELKTLANVIKARLLAEGIVPLDVKTTTDTIAIEYQRDAGVRVVHFQYYGNETYSGFPAEVVNSIKRDLKYATV